MLQDSSIMEPRDVVGLGGFLSYLPVLSGPHTEKSALTVVCRAQLVYVSTIARYCKLELEDPAAQILPHVSSMAFHPALSFLIPMASSAFATDRINLLKECWIIQMERGML